MVVHQETRLIVLSSGRSLCCRRAHRVRTWAHRKFYQRRIVWSSDKRRLGGNVSARRARAASSLAALRGLPRRCTAIFCFALDERTRAGGWGAVLDVYRGIWPGKILSRVLPRTGPAAGLCARSVFDGADFEPGDDSDRCSISVKNGP